jgi:hypothetical protein
MNYPAAGDICGELYRPPMSSPPCSSGLGLPVLRGAQPPDAAQCQVSWGTKLSQPPSRPPASPQLLSRPSGLCPNWFASFSSRFFCNCHSFPPPYTHAGPAPCQAGMPQAWQACHIVMSKEKYQPATVRRCSMSCWWCGASW